MPKSKQFGCPVPNIAPKEIRSCDVPDGESVPGLGWEISEETIAAMDGIDRRVRDGHILMATHPELFLLD